MVRRRGKTGESEELERGGMCGERKKEKVREAREQFISGLVECSQRAI